MPNENAPVILTDNEHAATNVGDAIDSALETEAGEGAAGDEGAEGAEGNEGLELPEGDEANEDGSASVSEANAEGEDEDAAAAAAEAEAEANLTPEEKAQRKLENALDAPIPQDLSKRTQERIRTLIDSTKTATESAQAVTQQLNVITGALRDSGATPQDFRQYVDFMRGLNSGDANQQKTAFDWLVTQVSEIADSLGLPVQIANPVQRHADLVAEVQAGKISLDRAMEIARGRNQQAARARQPVNNQPQNDPEAAKRAETAARQSLTEFGKRMQRVDRQYPQKSAKVIKQMKQMFGTGLENLPHNLWQPTFERIYRQTTVAVAPGAGNGQNSGGNQPMRHGKRPAGGQAPAPGKSMLDWVSQGIAEASGK